MNRDTTRQVAVIVATILTIVFNYGANALPLNGYTAGDVSDMFDVFFVPAGYVFSIWGLIYLGLGAYTVYQALPAQKENPVLRGIGYVYVGSCAANIVWLLFWHYLVFPITILFMLAILSLLVAIYLRLGTGRSRTSAGLTWFVRLPFSIYLGWISVATIANATTVLYDAGWNGWGISPVVWTGIMLLAGVLIAAAMSLTRGDVAYVLVIVWAFVGIAVKHAATPGVSVTAWIAAALAALSLILSLPQVRSRVRLA